MGRHGDGGADRQALFTGHPRQQQRPVVRLAWADVEQRVVTVVAALWSILQSPPLPPATLSFLCSCLARTRRSQSTGFRRSLMLRTLVTVTETSALTLRLEVGQNARTMMVEAPVARLQTETSFARSRNLQRTVESLPLTMRNFTQSSLSTRAYRRNSLTPANWAVAAAATTRIPPCRWRLGLRQ